MCSVMETFKKLARGASFNYADDSGKEWGMARSGKDQCIELYTNHPELRAEMEEVMKGELWANDFTRDAVVKVWAEEVVALDLVAETVNALKWEVMNIDIFNDNADKAWPSSVTVQKLRLLNEGEWFSLWADAAKKLRHEYRMAKHRSTQQ